MRVTYKLFALLSGFFALMFLVYGFWSQWNEHVGTVALLLSTLLAGMIAFYVGYTEKKIGLAPEDDQDGEIDQFEGDFGYFVPYSWQPLWIGLSAALCFAGLAVGWWLFIIGATFGVFAVIGWTFESYKGEHSL